MPSKNPKKALYAIKNKETTPKKQKVYTCPTPPLQAGYDTESIFKRSTEGLFKVFLLVEWLPPQGKRTKSAQLFTHRCKEKRCIYAFLINARWNEYNLVLPKVVQNKIIKKMT